MPQRNPGYWPHATSNQNLRRTRDLLLPRLLSWQNEVEACLEKYQKALDLWNESSEYQ
jgi:hypothetical protein